MIAPHRQVFRDSTILTALRVCFVYALITGCALSSIVWARSATSDEQAAITAAVKTFDAAFRSADYPTVLKLSIPPRLLAIIGKKFGVPADKLDKEVLKVMADTMSATRVEQFNMDVGAAEYRQLKTGELYALVPTSTIVSASNLRFSFKGYTLALQDEGKWWLVRLEQKQLPILLEAYPDFAGVEFPRETMEMLK